MTTNTPRTDGQFRDATKMVLDQKPARVPKQKKCTFCGGSGWWLDAMGTNSYPCECQNPKKVDHIVKVNKMVSDTPRTDAVMASSNWPYHITSEMQKIERELTELWLRFDKQMEAEAEVERRAERELYLAANADVKRIAEERNKAEKEVAKLNHQLLKTENDLLQSQDINSFLDAEFRIACKRAELAEAEVERLKEQLESTKLLAVKFWNALEETGFKIELPK